MQSRAAILGLGLGIAACASDPKPDAEPDAAPTSTAAPTSIAGSWTFHVSNVTCLDQPADQEVTITETGQSAVLTIPPPFLFAGTFKGTITANAVKFGGGGNSSGDCLYNGTIDPNGNKISGSFACDCPTGNWTVTR